MKLSRLAGGLTLAFLVAGCSAIVEELDPDDDPRPGSGGAGGENPGSGGEGGSSSGGAAGNPLGGEGGSSDAGAAGESGATGMTGEPPELAGIVELHNEVRRAHGVDALVWDDTLAEIAAAWIATCTDEEDPEGLLDHNPDRGVGYAGTVGENVWASSGTPSAEGAVDSWASEEEDYDYESNSCSGVCGHYTQLVWDSTTNVGCAVGTCEDLRFSNTIVCNYSPAGNFRGERPY